jgi:hypothetical protein
MSRTISPVSGKSYGLTLVCRIWRVPRATIYRHRVPPLAAAPRRPGPVKVALGLADPTETTAERDRPPVLRPVLRPSARRESGPVA